MQSKPIARPIPTVLLAWLAMLGWDFFLHAGLLARFYIAESPFLLLPAQAFSRIPLGYAAFLLLAIALVWLMPRFQIASWQAAFAFGLKFGALVWGALLLGLLSITTIENPLAAAWFFGQVLELGIGAAVIYWAANRDSLRSLTWRLLIMMLALVLVTVVMQSMGLAPAVIINR